MLRNTSQLIAHRNDDINLNEREKIKINIQIIALARRVKLIFKANI